MAKNQPIKTNEPDVINDGAPREDHLEKASGELGTDTVQKAVDEANEQGFIGEKTDPRPNTDYSQEGGMPV